MNLEDQKGTEHRRRAVYSRAVRALRQAGVPNPELDASVIMGFVTEEPPEKVLLDRDRPLAPQQALHYRDLIVRRCGREPVSQIVGYREFYSLTIGVAPGVLTPRPETETLVEEAIRCLEGMAGAPAVLDIGTGSGNIAIALATAVPRCRVVAVDISRAAVRTADANARRHGVRDRVLLFRGDLTEGLGAGGCFDMIVSNPPYIGENEFDRLSPEVRKGDPREALVAGIEGYGLFEPIAEQSFRLLRPAGILLVEVGMGQAPRVAEILARAGFSGLRVVDDLAGTGRVVAGSRNDA